MNDNYILKKGFYLRLNQSLGNLFVKALGILLGVSVSLKRIEVKQNKRKF